MGFDEILLKLDELLTSFLGDWDIYSTTLVALAAGFFAYQIFTRKEPDGHPFLMARQSQPSPIRNEGESSTYRSHSAPYGMDLTSGLNIKDEGVSKWARGRDGDLRDIWRRAANGETGQGEKSTTARGKLMTVLGSQQVIEHDYDEISQQINIIGQFLQQQGSSRIAIYLPNSIELLAIIFACAFYGQTAILLPYDESKEQIIEYLKASKADSIVAAAGSFSYDDTVKQYPSLRHVIWVVDEGNKHMDWTDVPHSGGGDGAVNVATWQTIIDDLKATTSTQLPAVDAQSVPEPLVAFWPTSSSSSSGGGATTKQPAAVTAVAYPHSALVAAVSGQTTFQPAAQRISASDLFVPCDSLAAVYPLVLTLTALFAGASIALNSVAGAAQTDLALATQGVAPTVIVAAPETLLQTWDVTRGRLTSLLLQLAHWAQTRAMTQDGVMPAAASLAARLGDGLRPAVGAAPGRLRLVFAAEQARGRSPPLNSAMLSDLRIFLGARIIYALTAAGVAGAVAQTSMHDYRVDDAPKGKCSHFGAPPTCVEILLRDTKNRRSTDEQALGEIIAKGPAVVGGEAALGVVGTIRDDYTLAYY